MAQPRKSLVATVQAQLQQLIIDGTFAVGDCLPSEGALAEQFEVSRTTMRDAVSALVEKGFLVRKHGKGVFVINKSERVVVDSLRNLMMRDNYTVAEFMETRRIIECQIAALAAIRATEDQVQQMKSLTAHMIMDTHVADIHEYAKDDVAFHLLLATAAQNRILFSFVRAIKPMLVQMVERVVQSGGKVERDSHFHERIIEAICAKDPVLAQQRMNEHLTASEKMFEDNMEADVRLDELIMSNSPMQEKMMESSFC